MTLSHINISLSLSPFFSLKSINLSLVEDLIYIPHKGKDFVLFTTLCVLPKTVTHTLLLFILFTFDFYF